jgi:hypothetical protein
LDSAQREFDAANAMLAEGKWTEAKQHWTSGAKALNGAREQRVDGKEMSTFVEPAKAAIRSKLDGAADKVLSFASESRENLTLIEPFVSECGSPQLNKNLQSQKNRWLEKFDAQELAKKAAAAVEERMRQTTAYAFWVEPTLGLGSEETNFKTQCLESLKRQFAPIPVELLPKLSLKDAGYAGTIILRLKWEYTQYGDPGLNNPLVADTIHNRVAKSVKATLSVNSRRAKTSLDGNHDWTASANTPAQIEGFSAVALRDQNLRSLLSSIAGKVSSQKNVVDADKIAQILAERAKKPKPAAIWAYRVISKSETDQAYAPRHDYSSSAGEIVDALQERFECLQLVPYEEKPSETEGLVLISVKTIESAYGEDIAKGMIATVSDSLPIAMTVSVELQPKTGTCKWGAKQPFTAHVNPPEKVDPDGQNAVLLEMAHTMIADIAAQIGKQPALAIDQKK